MTDTRGDAGERPLGGRAGARREPPGADRNGAGGDSHAHAVRPPSARNAAPVHAAAAGRSSAAGLSAAESGGAPGAGPAAGVSASGTGGPTTAVPAAATGAAGAVAGAVTAGLALVVWLANPYAAALLVPAAHFWLLAGMPSTRLRGVAAWLVVFAGIVPACLVLGHEMTALGLDPVESARAWLVAAAGGHVSVWTAAVAGLAGGALAVVVRAVLARRRIVSAPPPAKPRTRGPATYYGPGSLGGTESALRR